MSTIPGTARELAAGARERILRESHVVNDGLWFYAAHEQLGIAQANAMNARIVRKFATLEMLRLLRALGLGSAPDWSTFTELIERALELFVKDLFQAKLTRLDGKLHLEVHRCFAHEGVHKAGLADCYRCGPGQRLLGWIEASEAAVTISPEVGLCQMAKMGTCSYTLKSEMVSAAPGG